MQSSSLKPRHPVTAINNETLHPWSERQGVSSLLGARAYYHIVATNGELQHSGIIRDIQQRVEEHRRMTIFDGGRHVLKYRVATTDSAWDTLLAWEHYRFNQCSQHTLIFGAFIQSHQQTLTIDYLMSWQHNDETLEDVAARHGKLRRFVHFINTL